jgi:hypothetical protein
MNLWPRRRNKSSMYSRDKQKLEQKNIRSLRIKKEKSQVGTKKENSSLNGRKEKSYKASLSMKGGEKFEY